MIRKRRAAMNGVSERELQLIRLAVQEVLKQERGTSEQPRTMRYQKAAKMLDVSVSKVKSLVKSGEIIPVWVGGRKMIPLSEIERISTPTLSGKAAKSAAVPRARFDPKAEAAELRAALKANRKPKTP